jgi:hypothetical protein
VQCILGYADSSALMTLEAARMRREWRSAMKQTASPSGNYLSSCLSNARDQRGDTCPHAECIRFAIFPRIVLSTRLVLLLVLLGVLDELSDATEMRVSDLFNDPAAQQQSPPLGCSRPARQQSTLA